MADEAPKTLGRYEIVKELGKGAMGIVYEGRDPNIGRRVAIKTARRDVLEASGRADELMERFLREARAAGGLNHPNIITIYDAAEENGMAYIAMEFLEGGDLEEYMAKNKHIEAEKTVSILAKLCEALDAAHQNGIVHRDVKPANVMMIEGEDIKVADFGIAHVSDSNLTQEGSMIGTPHYMSPEQFQGLKIDGRSDLFAAGVIGYEMLTNEKPFTGEALSTVMTAVIKSTPIAPQELNISVSETVSMVIMKALSKNPNQRYQTGAEMAAALRESLEPNPNPAITQLVDTSDDATVVTGGGPDTTLAGAPPPTVEGTVAGETSSTEVEAAGVPEVESGGEPAVAEAGIQAPTPRDEMALEVPKEARKQPIWVIASAAAVVIVVLGILGVMMLPGGEPAVTVTPYITQVTVMGILFPDSASYVEWGGKWEEIPDFVKPAAGGRVTLYNNGDLEGPQMKNGLLNAEGSVALSVAETRPASLGVVLELDGYVSGEMVYSALEEGENAVVRMVLYKSDGP